MSNLSSVISFYAKETESEFEKYISEYSTSYSVLCDSMKYSLEAGGKRVRPFLTLAFCEMLCGDYKKALPFAVAVEMIHTSSLIHDDLPCMDNDDLRRGKPTNHKMFDEATALLAGDALLTLGLETAMSNTYCSVKSTLEASKMLAECTGFRGMMGGQQIDLSSEGKKINYETLLELQSLKTGRLIRAACLLGYYASDTCDTSAYDSTVKYADNIGRAFQIIDDILDVTSDEESMGKSLSDTENDKTTFISFMTVDEAGAEAERLTNEAIESLKDFNNNEILVEFAEYLLKRKK